MTAALPARFWILSGLPASGKSTLARELASALSLPLLDKDNVLEQLFDREGSGDRRARQDLSRAADVVFARRAAQTQGAVLASWWNHPRSRADSGTPTAWLASLPGARTEVYCRCGPPVAAQRFLGRERHPGHLDARWTHAELLASFELAASLGPLGVGDLVQVDTGGSECSTEAIADLAQAVITAACQVQSGPSGG